MDYKEKLEEAKRLYESANADQKYVFESLFPELAGNEDEKIRKALIHFVNSNKELFFGIDNYDGIKWVDILTWLEKQGHTDSIIEKAKKEKQRVIITETDGNANIDWDTRSLKDARKLLERGLQYVNTELEKQGDCKCTQKEWGEEDERIREGDFPRKLLI